MVISNLLLMLVGLLVLGCVTFMFLKYRGRTWSNFKLAFSLGFIAALGAVLLITRLAKKIVVVEDFGEAGYYRHTEVNVYGHPNIKLHDGDSFPTKGLKLAFGKKYLFNCSSSGMLLYPIVYGNSSGLPSSFKKSDNYNAPDPTYIESGCYDEIASIPNFWFREVPPTSISTSEHIFQYIWNTFFGSVEVRWRIVPYELPADSEE